MSFSLCAFPFASSVALFAGLPFAIQILWYIGVILGGCVLLICSLLLIEVWYKIVRYPFTCMALVRAINSLYDTDIIPVADICASERPDTNEFPSNPHAPPVHSSLWPVKPTPRYRAAISWAHGHDLLFMGCYETTNHAQRMAYWIDLRNVTFLLYAIDNNGKEVYAFGTEFTDGDLNTSDNFDQLPLPRPPKRWNQLFTFPPGKKSTGDDESSAATAEFTLSETPPAYYSSADGSALSAALCVATDRLDSLYELHKKGVRYLVDNDWATLLPPGIGSLEKYWERKDISFQAALQSNDLTDVRKAIRLSYTTEWRTMVDYVRSLPCWRIRIAHWFSSRPKKWANKTIEEQLAKVKH